MSLASLVTELKPWTGSVPHSVAGRKTRRSGNGLDENKANSVWTEYSWVLGDVGRCWEWEGDQWEGDRKRSIIGHASSRASLEGGDVFFWHWRHSLHSLQPGLAVDLRSGDNDAPFLRSGASHQSWSLHGNAKHVLIISHTYLWLILKLIMLNEIIGNSLSDG